MRGGPLGQFGIDTREHLFSWLTPFYPAIREDGVEGQGIAGAGGWGRGGGHAPGSLARSARTGGWCAPDEGECPDGNGHASHLVMRAGPEHIGRHEADAPVSRGHLPSGHHQHWWVVWGGRKAALGTPGFCMVAVGLDTIGEWGLHLHAGCMPCSGVGWGGVQLQGGGGGREQHVPAVHPPLHHPRALAGTIGHVAHGKSTVVKAISGVQTVRFKNELERNITIKLGYANAKIYACSDPKCPRPAAYRAYSSSKEDAPPCDVPGFEGVPMTLLRHVSFVDCPGHDILMATMLNGAAVMDGALLLIAANEPCPQPQTSEHLAAVEIMQLRHIIILQNKVDLVTESAALNQAEAIARFVQGTIAEPAPVVPVSAQLKYNIDAVCEYLVKKIPIPVRDFVSPPQARVLEVWEGTTKGGGSHALGACSCRARGDAEPPGRLNVGEANPAIPMRRPSSR